MTVCLSMRRRKKYIPGELPPDLIRNVKGRAEDAMFNFDRLPDYIQERIRETGSPAGAQPPKRSLEGILAIFKPGLVVFAAPRGIPVENLGLAVDSKRDVVMVSIRGVDYDFFNRAEIESGEYKAYFGQRLNAILDKVR